MQREHLEMYFPSFFKKKRLLNISNLDLKSIVKPVFTDLTLRNRPLKIYRHIDICRFSDRKNIAKNVSLNRQLLF